MLHNWLSAVCIQKANTDIDMTEAWCQSGTRDLLLYYIDGSVQDCSISIANAMEIMQSRIKPFIYISLHFYVIHYCRFSATQMATFLGIHKAIIDINSGLVPVRHNIDGSMQDHSISIAKALDIS